ncbi:hypothetical protein [Mycolicibacterium hodleri]|uniref:hypothetical protein n=1 Tax=Mycolicibacterium hodleri TaxID=49897 RepID=UPI00137591DE|nr:hypothetical protein [Mycolicibacterium hodleri]
MKKSTILAAAAFTGLGAAIVAPAAVADPRISVPFDPVSVLLDPPNGDDGWAATQTK